jgi:XTP/dITP diphosphohydrolase
MTTSYAAGTEAFGRLLKIMDELREQCPWDRAQTMHTLRHLTLEEVHELSESILADDLPEVKKELGDLLLHIVFYARLADEQKVFDIAGLIHQLCEKLIRRHPHIYGNVSADNADAVKANWEEIKLKEGNKTVLGGVPKGLPALVKAYRIQEKVSSVGFDWENSAQVLDKVEEEIGELRQVLPVLSNKQTLADDALRAQAEAELGDVLFSIVNYARFLGINADDALEKTNRKFLHRFAHVEAAAQAAGKPLKDHSLAELNALWDDAKRAHTTI